MLELRYNGCSYCLTTATTVLRNVGMFKGRDYIVEYHDAHKKDKIYQVRPDYLEIFSGAILYNPKTGHWVDFYDKTHSNCLLKASTSAERAEVGKLFISLAEGA